MATIKEEAQAYEPKQTRNIAELDKVSIDMELVDKVIHEGEPDEFSIKQATIDGEDYRVPGVVLGQLKEQIEGNPDMKFFSVTKKGEGVKTKYTVIPILK